MSIPTRHINLAMIATIEKHHPERHLALAAAKSGHTQRGSQYGSKYDMNFHNEYSQFHAMPRDTGLMKDLNPRKVVRGKNKF
jgi:hypothetical protein